MFGSCQLGDTLEQCGNDMAFVQTVKEIDG
jgi:hypothetical protein